ncbi:MTA/SAH nucleosidase [Candidatus Vecturithrix granuli]|uniref:adenosylhomocysteine nucleosidase n=1 Tax=Vecturithrix granuli TaxID=1499967 RepID=A0A081C8F8_VECG1|nr:MTA/SAH nucleosidase [Candidatus Vecturithrix granuli]
MTQIAILCALPAEIAPFKRALQLEQARQSGVILCWSAKHGAKTITLVQTGVGKVQAAAAAQQVIMEYAPDAMFSCGTAGSLCAQARIGDIVLGAATLQHDYGFILPDAFIPFGFLMRRTRGKAIFLREFPADADLLNAAKILEVEKVCTFSGKILSGDQVIFSAAKRAVLAQQFQALAVDMESAAIAQICAIHQVPFLAVRGLSDFADESSFPLDVSKIDLNEVGESASGSFGDKLSLLTKVVRYFARHPAAFRLSLQARQNISMAARQSARFTLALLERL